MRRWIAMVVGVCAWSTAALPDTLLLANGDELTGDVVEWDVRSVVLEHPQLGRVRLSLDQLQVESAKPPKPGLFGTDFLRGWTRTLDVGANGKDGNTINQNLTMGLELDYKDDFKRWEIRARYFFASEDNRTTENNGRVTVRRDWLLPDSRFFWRAGSRFQFDKFESWKTRYLVFAGPGYHLIDGEKHRLDGLVGADVAREEGERKDTLGEAIVGFDYAWTISEVTSFEFSNLVFTQVVPNAGEIRNLTTSELRWELTEEPVLSLKLGFENEYETEVERGDSKNDLYYYLTLGLDF